MESCKVYTHIRSVWSQIPEVAGIVLCDLLPFIVTEDRAPYTF